MCLCMLSVCACVLFVCMYFPAHFIKVCMFWQEWVSGVIVRSAERPQIPIKWEWGCPVPLKVRPIDSFSLLRLKFITLIYRGNVTDLLCNASKPNIIAFVLSILHSISNKRWGRSTKSTSAIPCNADCILYLVIEVTCNCASIISPGRPLHCCLHLTDDQPSHS